MDSGGVFTVSHTIGSIPCCRCGVPMSPNAVNMCASCLRSEIDITEGLTKQVTIMHCPECDRYLQPPGRWLKGELESKELLKICLGRLNHNFNKSVRLVHAEFVWTEPHSKRIKVKLKVQQEVLSKVVLEQSYIVEYVQQDHMCDSCSRVQANPDQWLVSVQLRQQVPHRRTFFRLEQLILKHNAVTRAVRIQQMDRGIDFFFAHEGHASSFVNFVSKVTPVRSHEAKQLVSQDSKSNTYHYKYTRSVEISPICRGDLICLPRKLVNSFGNVGPLVICTKVTNSITLLDPLSLRVYVLNAKHYWMSPFKSFLNSRQLAKYIVFDVEPCSAEVNVGGSKYALADVQVARESNVGRLFQVRTHLGHILKPGDEVLGYDLYAANCNDVELDKYGNNLLLPEVILIQKFYVEKWRANKSKSENCSSPYQEFVRDLEENPGSRFNLSLEDKGMDIAMEDLFSNLNLSSGGDDDDGDEDDDRMQE